MSVSENNIKYKNEWIEYLQIINKYLNKNIKLDEQFLINLIKDYVVLTKLALIEIDLDTNETNKCLAKANVGLDCWDLILNNLISYSSQFLPLDKLEEIIKFVSTIENNNIDESFLSNSYKERKRLEESDTKLESFVL